MLSAKNIEKGKRYVESLLDEFIGRLNIDKISYMPTYNDVLYHYTSLGNINSILLNGKGKIVLWASRYDCLNDASEGKVISDAYQKTCEKLKIENKIDQNLYQVIVGVKLNRTSLFLDKAKNRPVRCEVDTYITSFSTTHDLLSMWNYYSKGNMYDGINLGFDSNTLKRSLANDVPSNGVYIQICPVIYDEEKQIKLIEDFLLELKDKYKNGQDDQYLRYVIAYKLSEWKMLFKSSHFEHEKEVRIIIRIGKKFPDAMSVKYRNNLGYIIPYIELEINKNSLTQVTFGPLLGDENQKNVQMGIMKEILNKNNYSAKIGFSEIPIRY